MNRMLFATIGLALIPAGSVAAEPATTTAALTQRVSPPVSGIDLQYVDSAVRPQDDFYRAVNGKWLDTFTIPADKGRYSAFDSLDDATQEHLKAIIDDVATATDAAGDADVRKIRDLYNGFMDEAKLEELGKRPLEAELARIEALKDKNEIPALIAHFNRLGIAAPYRPQIHQDARDSTRYIVDLRQSGLGLPDRDYYLDDRFKDARGKYAVHIEKMLGMAGDRNATKSAKDVLALETEMAKVQWTRVENRDPVKTYNRVELAQLASLAPGYDWKRWLIEAGIDGKIDYLVVSQPSYLTALSRLLATTPLPVWTAYFKWRLLSDASPYLSKAYLDESFAFYGSTLRGIPQNLPRWKRGVDLIGHSIGEGLGKLYVDKYFRPESRTRMEALVSNLLSAYKQSLDTLDWMSPQTKKEAQSKLARFTSKIAHPKKWRDYSALVVVKDDLIGNVMRARAFEYKRNTDKLGKPIDHDEWGMTPQTVNAYYNPERNEIVFPAAILQPPFFNEVADDAVNYGSIGAVIGHEISHGFDDQGSQYDGAGNLRQWFTADDLRNFKAKANALVAQYAEQEPVPGFHVNGELTLGENVADNSGLAIAYKAYKLSLQGKESPVIDGLTGEQRLYYGWAGIWRGKTREAEMIRRLKTDSHSPIGIRGLTPLRNQPGFYEAFGVKEGDKMYLPPGQRVMMW